MGLVRAVGPVDTASSFLKPRCVPGKPFLNEAANRRQHLRAIDRTAVVEHVAREAPLSFGAMGLQEGGPAAYGPPTVE